MSSYSLFKNKSDTSKKRKRLQTTLNTKHSDSTNMDNKFINNCNSRLIQPIEHRESYENIYKTSKRLRMIEIPWCIYSDFEDDDNPSSDNESDDSIVCLGSVDRPEIPVIDLLSNEDRSERNSSMNNSRYSRRRDSKDKINTRNELRKFDEILSKYRLRITEPSNTSLNNEDRKIIEEYASVRSYEDNRMLEFRNYGK